MRKFVVLLALALSINVVEAKDMSITVNIYYTGENGNARKFAEEMEKSGTADAIRKEKGNLRYEYFYPLNDEETVLFVLYNYDQTNSDSISFGWPINFYNPSKKAIELEYTINSKGCTYFNIPGYNRYKTHNAITILREESTPAIIQFKASREEIDEKGRLEGDFRLFWHYENMSDRNKVLFHYVLFPFNDSTANYVIQEDWVIRFINDGNENGHFSLLKIWKTE